MVFSPGLGSRELLTMTPPHHQLIIVAHESVAPMPVLECRRARRDRQRRGSAVRCPGEIWPDESGSQGAGDPAANGSLCHLWIISRDNEHWGGGQGLSLSSEAILTFGGYWDTAPQFRLQPALDGFFRNSTLPRVRESRMTIFEVPLLDGLSRTRQGRKETDAS